MVIDDGVRSKTSNKKLILLGVAVVAVIIIIGVLAGVLSANREKDKCDERVKEAVRTAKLEWEKENATSAPEETTTATDRFTTRYTTLGATTPSSLKPWDKIRLPSDVEPVHYDMLIRVYLDTLTFSGNSNISIKVTDPTDKILFHVNKINIKNVEVVDSNAKSYTIKEQFNATKRQFYVVILDERLAVGDYELRLEFVANIETKELNGFYKSTYKSSANETR